MLVTCEVFLLTRFDYQSNEVTISEIHIVCLILKLWKNWEYAQFLPFLVPHLRKTNKIGINCEDKEAVALIMLVGGHTSGIAMCHVSKLITQLNFWFWHQLEYLVEIL